MSNEEVLHRVEGGEEYLAFDKRRKANWTGLILHMNCPLEQSLKERQREGYK